MLPPAELLEQALGTHGDPLYRVALLLAADEAVAEQLLRRLAVAWRESPPLTPPDEPALLARLVAVARANAARPVRPARSRTAISFAPFPIASLPLDQRLALGLHLLLGYDSARVARVLGGDESAARAALMAAVEAVAPAAGRLLPDRVSGELCHDVRVAIADPSAGARQSAVRGHLATCSLCRAFDQGWGEILQAAEGSLRAALRPRAMPPALAARLVAAASPVRRRISPSLRLALPPLAVLALIAALVLPGFLRPAVNVVERDLAEAVEPRALIERALARHSTPEDRGGVWYGRYTTQWYFNDNTYAPLSAELWLDPRNPARHRTQLTHAAGGAPYELQIGNGRDRLYYAVDGAYAPSLYGGLPTRARPESPALLAEPLDAEGQRRARDERLAAGPWAIPPFYLNQARDAADLRVLGRQRDGQQTVQILSFSGISPLGLPRDAPGATAERVTVLLALGLNDGLLRSATELSGPAGAEQTSRVTWRLEQEQWLVTADQISAAFDIGRAWTGMGDFSEIGRHESADLALPLISARLLGDPAQLLSAYNSIGPFWMPSAPPAGVDRALLLWPESAARNGTPPQGLIYLGPGRRLVIAFNIFTRIEGEQLRTGAWDGTLRGGRGGRYTMIISRSRTGFDPSANMLIDAFGFTREELLAVVERLAPFDLAALAAQDELFAGPRGDREARAALLRVALDSSATPEGRVRYTRARQFVRQGPSTPDPRADPYHARPYEDRPSMITVEEWIATGAAAAYYLVTSDPASGATLTSFFHNDEQAWTGLHSIDTLQRWSDHSALNSLNLAHSGNAALDLMTTPGGELTMRRLPGGTMLFSAAEQLATSPRYRYLLDQGSLSEPYLADLNPEMIITELQLRPDGTPEATRVYAALPNGRRELVASYELVEQAELPLAEAPAPLRDGEAPQLAYTADFRPAAADRPWASSPIATFTLSQALTLNAGAVYVLDGSQLLYVEQAPVGSSVTGHGSTLDEALSAGLALRVTHSVPVTTGAAQTYYLRITQGPAAPLGAFLRSIQHVPWTTSQPVRVTIAGREVDAWVGEGGEYVYLMAELDDTLLIADVPWTWYAVNGLSVFDGLTIAARP